MRLFLLLCCLLNTFSHILSFRVGWQKAPHTRRRTAGSVTMMSYGDPDLGKKWTWLRLVQGAAKEIDDAAYPDDPDVPGLTFLSPVEWAPWMETIWFGNQYEYRSAYFHDVMYSNNEPFKEGALLFSDQRKAREVALLYQRYKKFDTDSYSLPNATFFNIFGTNALRIGRYKVPQDNSLILCTTDPLTITEMKRYFNSFAPFKWFRSKFMQQKRKRQFIMDISADGDGSDVGVLVGGGQDGGSFFSTCVHKIEHGRWEDKDAKNNFREGRIIPILPIDSPYMEFIGDGHGRGGLYVPISVANSQYFFESLVHNTLMYTARTFGGDTGDINVYMGGDGRLLNSFAMELALRVMAGNRIRRVHLAKRGILTTSEVIATMERKKSKRGSVGIVWTAAERQGGLKGSMGLQLVLAPPGEEHASLVVGEEGWKEILSDMRKCREVQMVSKRPQAVVAPVKKFNFLGTEVRPFSPSRELLSSLQSEYNFPALKTFLEKSGFTFTIDCLHGGGGASTKRVLKELGLDPKKVLVNDKVSVDRDGAVFPHLHSQEGLIKLFSVPSLDIEKILSYPTEIEKADTLSNASSGPIPSCPDAGFIFDANAQHCIVVTYGLRVSEQESNNVLSRLPKHQRRPSCALHCLLGWLTTIANDPEAMKAPSRAVRREVHRCWQAGEGRKLSIRLLMKVEESQAVTFMNRLKNLPSNPRAAWTSVNVQSKEVSDAQLIRNASETTALERNSSKEFARSAIITITADGSATALGIVDLREARLTVSTEGLTEMDDTTEDKEAQMDGSTGEGNEEEVDEWETRRGLLGAAMMDAGDQKEASEPAFAKVIVDMAVEIKATDSADLTMRLQSENEVWGRILKCLRDSAPDSPLVIEDIEVSA